MIESAPELFAFVGVAAYGAAATIAAWGERKRRVSAEKLCEAYEAASVQQSNWMVDSFFSRNPEKKYAPFVAPLRSVDQPPRNWIACQDIREIPGNSWDTREDDPAANPGDTRVVEITGVVPHLFRLDRYNPAYVKGPGMHGNYEVSVPARWWPTKLGTYQNGMFATHADALAASTGPIVLTESKT